MIMNTRQAIYIAILAERYFSSANKRVITWSRKHFSYRTKMGTLIFLDKSRKIEGPGLGGSQSEHRICYSLPTSLQKQNIHVLM